MVDIPDSKIIDITLNFRAGGYFCSSEKIETAHTLEHMTFKANKFYRNEQKFLKEIGQNGAYHNAFTDKYNIEYIISCADFEWERVLKLFLIAITKPLFVKKQFTEELKVIKEELSGKLNLYGRILGDEMSKNIDGIDYTLPTRVKILDNVLIEDVRKFYQKTHYTQNMRFVVAGNLKSKKQKIQKILSDIELPQNNKTRLEGFKSPLHKINHPITLTYKSVDSLHFIYLIVRKRRFSIKERTNLAMLCNILTGDYGCNSLTSRINSKARTQGLNYGINSGITNGFNEGYFHISGKVAQENSSMLFNLIQEELHKILDGQLKNTEVQSAKQRYLGFRHLIEPTTSRLSSHYCSYFNKDKVIEYDAGIKHLPSVNKKQILDLFNATTSEKHWYLGLLGPKVDNYKNNLYHTLKSITQAKN